MAVPKPAFAASPLTHVKRSGFFTRMQPIARFAYALPLGLLLVLGASPSRAAAPGAPFADNPQYASCLAAIKKKPDDAFEQAMTWRDHGGGLPARHCVALALLALNEPGEAAVRLDKMAHSANAGGAAERAALLDQSGNAWLLAHEPADAEKTFSAALKLTPRDPDIWTDRARARAMNGNFAGAESDLTKSLSFKSNAPEVYVLRASAREAEGKKTQARADIDAALKIDPTFPDALIERSKREVAEGDDKAARADWVKILQRAPDSPAADEARKEIEKLDFHPDR